MVFESCCCNYLYVQLGKTWHREVKQLACRPGTDVVFHNLLELQFWAPNLTSTGTKHTRGTQTYESKTFAYKMKSLIGKKDFKKGEKEKNLPKVVQLKVVWRTLRGTIQVTRF